MNTPTLDQILAQGRVSGPESGTLDETLVKLVIFELSGQLFAFPGEKVREILAHAQVHFVPGAPPSMEGVVNARGDIETVIRLQARLQLPDPPEQPGPASAILLTRGGGVTSGIRVDRVVDVLDLPQSAIVPLPASLPAHWSALTFGMLNLNDQPVILLDLDVLLGDYARGLG
ncbi:MAG: purine-binding chemotaxis protein CheW [Magnetococcales bacterium]|nr:purine-binding chemotaxis protein CheW [Magnetococcales bacterium]